MTDRLDLLFQHCADLGLDVEWADLGDNRRGHFTWSTGVIWLNLRLTRAQCISTLAHEISHAECGDCETTPAIERRAWQHAAALLITPAQYAAAEAAAGHHLGALALELEVTPRVVESWRTWWSRRGGAAEESHEGL